MNKIFGVIVLLSCLLSACKNKKAQENHSASLSSLGDFEAFYEKFHSDSLYQVEHVSFPLQGLPTFADSAVLADREYYWSKDLWVMHKKPELDTSGYEREITTFGNSVIIERLIQPVQSVFMERRFSKIGNDWYLIYYSGLNAYVKKGKSAETTN